MPTDGRFRDVLLRVKALRNVFCSFLGRASAIVLPSLLTTFFGSREESLSVFAVRRQPWRTLVRQDRTRLGIRFQSHPKFGTRILTKGLRPIAARVAQCPLQRALFDFALG
jgi:hypothetical protein